MKNRGSNEQMNEEQLNVELGSFKSQITVVTLSAVEGHKSQITNGHSFVNHDIIEEPWEETLDVDR
jgi:hypothetical protein